METKEEQDDIDNVTDESLKHLARVLAAEQDVARHPEHSRLDFFLRVAGRLKTTEERVQDKWRSPALLGAPTEPEC